MILSNEEFKQKVFDFMKAHQISATTFGILANKEPNFVFLLKSGRECRESTQKRVLDFIRRYEEEAKKDD